MPQLFLLNFQRVCTPWRTRSGRWGCFEQRDSLSAVIEKLYGSQAGGYYDPATEGLVPARDILVMVPEPVVRYQLVHALQDQTWDLKERLKMIGSTVISSYREAHPEDPGCKKLYRRSPRTTAEGADAKLWEQGGPKRLLRAPGTFLPGFFASLRRFLAHLAIKGLGEPASA